MNVSNQAVQDFVLRKKVRGPFLTRARAINSQAASGCILPHAVLKTVQCSPPQVTQQYKVLAYYLGGTVLWTLTIHQKIPLGSEVMCLQLGEIRLSTTMENWGLKMSSINHKGGVIVKPQVYHYIDESSSPRCKPCAFFSIHALLLKKPATGRAHAL